VVPDREELFHRVDAVLEQSEELPPPDERRRLRKAAKMTQQALADLFGVRRESVRAWESGVSEPRSPKREAYARLLAGWGTKYPAVPDASGTAPTATTPVEEP
jgi:DNA-binding transcriptional regulator YiaG